MTQDRIERIRQCQDLPALPGVAVQVFDMVQKPDADVNQIAKVISRDPALASKILQTVNSSFYARSNSVSSINHALVILGLQSIKSLVLGFSLVSHMRERGFNHGGYWRGSLYAATAARAISERVGVFQQEEAFLAALLGDIGTLVLHQTVGEEYARLCETAASHVALLAAEREMLGIDHAQVAGILASHWKLPPVLALPMAHHHDAAAIGDASLLQLGQAVQAGGRCADVFVDANPSAALADVRKLCFDFFQMTEGDCDALMSEVDERAREVAPLFEVPVTDTPVYEQILQAANDAMARVARESSGAAAASTGSSPSSNAATPRTLRSISDRAGFEKLLAAALAGAVTQGSMLSVVLLEVDHLKMLESEQGRAASERVLQTVGRLLAAVARPQDHPARLEGERLVLLMPGASRAQAAASAEAIRKALTSRPIACGNGMAVPITLSAGVATYEPGLPLREPGHLMKAADLAVLAARQSGRNCVRVFTLPKATRRAAA